MYENFRNFLLIIFTITKIDFTIKKADFRPATRESMTSETTWYPLASETTWYPLASKTTCIAGLDGRKPGRARRGASRYLAGPGGYLDLLRDLELWIQIQRRVPGKS